MSTVINYWLVPHLGPLTFHQLNGVVLKEFLQKLVWQSGKKAGERLSASRISNILIPLRTIWNDACEQHRWDLPDPFRYLKKYIPTRTEEAPEVFRFEEWVRLLDKMDPFYRCVADVMLLTGLSGSEIAGLRKQDINGSVIAIQNSIVRNYVKAQLKNRYRGRKLPLTRALRQRLDVALNRSQGEYVFTMKSGLHFDVDSFRKNAWTSAMKKAGLPYRKPYTTRHSFAAWSLTGGMDPSRLVRLMGHGSKKMVYDVYGKYVEGLETDAGKIQEYFGRDFFGLE